MRFPFSPGKSVPVMGKSRALKRRDTEGFPPPNREKERC